MSLAEGVGRFRWKDYAHGRRLKAMALAAPETVGALLCRLTGVEITRRPVGRVGRLHLVGHLRPGAQVVPVLDTS